MSLPVRLQAKSGGILSSSAGSMAYIHYVFFADKVNDQWPWLFVFVSESVVLFSSSYEIIESILKQSNHLLSNLLSFAP